MNIPPLPLPLPRPLMARFPPLPPRTIPPLPKVWNLAPATQPLVIGDYECRWPEGRKTCVMHWNGKQWHTRTDGVLTPCMHMGKAFYMEWR